MEFLHSALRALRRLPAQCKLHQLLAVGGLWALLWFGVFGTELLPPGAQGLVLFAGLVVLTLFAVLRAVMPLLPPLDDRIAVLESQLSRSADPLELAKLEKQQKESSQQLETLLDNNLKWRNAAQTGNRRLQALISGTEERVLVVDEDTRVVGISSTAATLLAIRSNEVLGRKSSEVLQLFNARKERPEEYPLRTFVEDVIARSSAIPNLQEVILQDARDKTHTVMLYSESVLSEEGRGIGAILRIRPEGGAGEDDATAALASPSRGSQNDPTTKLPGQAAFDNRLSELIQIAQQQQATHQLLLIAVDNLQTIYDQLGFWAGEEVLWQVGQLIREEAADSVDLYRVTAVHFALLLPFESERKAERTGERIRCAIEAEMFMWRDAPYQVTTSISICGIDESAAGTTAVLAQADEGLRAARQAGGNTVQRHELDELLLVTQDIERELLEWVNDDNNNHLQLQSRELVSGSGNTKPLVEAMLRVELDDGHWSDPAAFVSSAKNFGLAHRIDIWLLRHTLESAQNNPLLEESHGQILIPVSGESLSSDSFLEDARNAIRSSAIPASRIVLMISARSARARPSKAADFFAMVKECGAGYGLRQCRLGAFDDLIPRVRPSFVSLHPQLLTSEQNPLTNHQLAFCRAVADELSFALFAIDIDDASKRQSLLRQGLDYVGDKGGPLGPLSPFLN